MTRYYFVVEFLPKEAAATLLVGRCIKVLHGFLISNDIHCIGITFPLWEQKTIGKCMAFVSDNKIALQFLTSQQYFKVMVGEGVFNISDIEIVPNSCKEIRFKRNQRISKHSVNGKRRRVERTMRRAQTRGENYSSQIIDVVKPIGLFHSVSMSSRTNHQPFILNIQKEDIVEQSSSTFNNYGLATCGEHRGTVPDLTDVIAY